MIVYVNMTRIQTDAINLFREMYPEIHPISQGSFVKWIKN